MSKNSHDMATARALVLEEKGRLTLRDTSVRMVPGPGEVAIDVDRVGICGSDVHYYTHGRIGPFVVDKPMILGHEAAGTVSALGEGVTGLRLGDRVCMEPGIPDLSSRASKLGIYNVDPSVTFWATPPIDGCLTPTVVHPAAFTYPLPEHVSFAEGAMVEPLAIGLQAAKRAGIEPGDLALVTGAGPIGILTALSALAGGCARVLISDLVDEKLKIAAQYEGIETINVSSADLNRRVADLTGGWGVDKLFECSGAAPVIATMAEHVRPGGCITLVGMPVDPVPVDIVSLQARELRLETVFRYANVFDRAVALIGSGKIDMRPLISATVDFEDAIAGFERAVEARPEDVKIQIRLGGGA